MGRHPNTETPALTAAEAPEWKPVTGLKVSTLMPEPRAYVGNTGGHSKVGMVMYLYYHKRYHGRCLSGNSCDGRRVSEAL